MDYPTDIPVIAVDGGGTRCRLALRDASATFEVETGPANVSTGFDAAVRALREGLDALAERCGRTTGALMRVTAYFGLAGMVDERLAERLRTALPFDRMRIEDDRPAAVRGALGRADGFVAHCGTGSFLAEQRGSGLRLAGGWGAALGDEASAQWMGRRMLGTVLRTVDGRLPASPLATTLLAEFGGAPGILRFAAGAGPDAFGALAPRVTEHAGRGDPLALGLLQSGADHLARDLRALGWEAGGRICLTGGIGPHFTRFLPEEMQRTVAPPQADPLAGALSLARDFAGLDRDAAG